MPSAIATMRYIGLSAARRPPISSAPVPSPVSTPSTDSATAEMMLFLPSKITSQDEEVMSLVMSLVGLEIIFAAEAR